MSLLNLKIIANFFERSRKEFGLYGVFQAKSVNYYQSLGVTKNFEVFMSTNFCLNIFPFFRLKLKLILRVNSSLLLQSAFICSGVSHCCSDFRYESDGIFLLGVGFFSSDKSRLFN